MTDLQIAILILSISGTYRFIVAPLLYKYVWSRAEKIKELERAKCSLENELQRMTERYRLEEREKNILKYNYDIASRKVSELTIENSRLRECYDELETQLEKKKDLLMKKDGEIELRRAQWCAVKDELDKAEIKIKAQEERIQTQAELIEAQRKKLAHE